MTRDTMPAKRNKNFLVEGKVFGTRPMCDMKVLADEFWAMYEEQKWKKRNKM